MVKCKKAAVCAVLISELTAVLMSSGCSVGSVEELLSPPVLDYEQTKIYEALRSYTRGDITLKYPKSGQYRSAFVTRDLDGDGEDEAIAFYEAPNISDGSSLRINFLDIRDGEWSSVYDFSLSGSEVESVIFGDLGNNAMSVLVTYLVQNTSDKATSVFQYRDGTPAELFKGRHSFMRVFDTNGNGYDEMFMIISDRNTASAVADIFGFAESTFTLKGAAPLSSGYADFRNASVCLYDENRSAIFIDYMFSDGSAGTDAVIRNGIRYVLSEDINSKTVSRVINSYTPPTQCCDIDDDGIIEIPATVPFDGYSELTAAEQVNMTVWYVMDASGKASEKTRSFVGTRGDYILIIPQKWYGRISAEYSITEGCVTFGRYSGEDELLRNNLVKIYGAPEGGTAKYEDDAYIFLGKSSTTGYSYYARLLGEGGLSLTEEELHELFILKSVT